MTILRELSWT